METREAYSIDQTIEQWFQVELLDRTGRSHGFIGYRFNAPGAEAVANGWNADRDRGDLIAVIKPFEPANSAAAKDAAKPVDRQALDIIGDPRPLDQQKCLKKVAEFAEAVRAERSRIVSAEDPTAKLRGHNKMLTRALGACLTAMANGSPSDHYRNRWLKARQLADDVLAEIALHTPFTG